MKYSWTVGVLSLVALALYAALAWAKLPPAKLPARTSLRDRAATHAGEPEPGRELSTWLWSSGPEVFPGAGGDDVPDAPALPGAFLERAGDEELNGLSLALRVGLVDGLPLAAMLVVPTDCGSTPSVDPPLQALVMHKRATTAKAGCTARIPIFMVAPAFLVLGRKKSSPNESTPLLLDD